MAKRPYSFSLREMKVGISKMKAQKCPVCGTGTLKKQIGTEVFKYKGESLSIPGFITYECNDCGESIVDNQSLKDARKPLKDFHRRVDGLLSGDEIKAIRKKLNLKQEEMAEILGGGLKSFARYENGQVCQSKGMDSLLRILNAYPFALDVIMKNKVEKPVIDTEKKVIPYEDFQAFQTYKDKFQGYVPPRKGEACGF
jgi:HTH-type transcriptional regulator / antitoxin MqsA